MTKKAQINFSIFLIAIVVFMGILIGFSSFYIDVGNHYGVSTSNTTAFKNTYDKVDRMNAQVETMNNIIKPSSIGAADETGVKFGDLWSLIQTGYDVITFPTEFIQDMANQFQIPKYWITIATMIIIIMIMTTILYLAFNVAK